jgi:hypothetical protein
MRTTLRRVNLGFFSVFTLIASGCVSLRPYDPGPGKRVAASFVQDTYVSGASVNVTIANLSEVMLFYPDGFCKTELQRKNGTSWVTVPAAVRSCTPELGFLDPGQAVVHQFRLPDGVVGGLYRFVMPTPAPDKTTAPNADLLLDPDAQLVSPTFRVESPVIATTSQSNKPQ